MVKRFLTFALSVGFFIWLPNAFADGGGPLSLDAPSSIRQTQGDDNALLTLRVDNIQVRAEWRVTDANDVFTIKAENNAGMLQTVKTIVAPVKHVATIYAVDRFDLLNTDYANLTASAVITVEFLSGDVLLADAPPLFAIAGREVSLHIFIATEGMGEYTYSLVAGDGLEYFTLGETNGVLSVLADAAVRGYTLSVEVMDESGNKDGASAVVGVSLALSLPVPPLTVIAGKVAHTLTASDGIGIKTYTILAGGDGHFTADATSGALSVAIAAEIKTYTLTVQAADEQNNTVVAVATVAVSAVLELTDAPPFMIIASVDMSLHTFIATGGIGIKTYTILAGDDEGYFSVDDGSGVLSLRADAPLGRYILTVQATDKQNNTAEALAVVGVSAALSLADAPRLLVPVKRAATLHTFVASGGIGDKTYIIVAGNNDFTLGSGSGILSIQGNAPVGIYTLSVQASDTKNHRVQVLATVQVVSLDLADAPMLYAITGREVSLHTFVASGIIGSLTYAIVAGNGNSYFSLDPDSGLLAVHLSATVGIYTLSVEVMDSANSKAAAMAVVEVRPPLLLEAVPLLIAVEQKMVSLYTFAASGGIGAATYTWAAGNSLGYFDLDATSGVLSLSAEAVAGKYTLTVRVTDARDNRVEAMVRANISAALSLVDAPRLFAAKEVAMSLHTFVASGGLGVKTYALVAGAEYFTVGSASGVLSVNAEVPIAVFTLSVRVTDADGTTADAVATVEAVSLLLADVMLYEIVGRKVDLHTLAAAGGGDAKVYTIVDGNDDDYFGIDADSGVLSVQGNPTVAIYTLSVAVDDSIGSNSTAQVLVEVRPSLSVVAAPLLTVAAGKATYLHTFSTSGGIGAKTYILMTGGDYFVLNAASGDLSLQASTGKGFYTLTVEATDGRGNTAKGAAMVEVSAVLALADAPPLTVVASVALSLHTFAARDGIGVKTYNLRPGAGAEYFEVDGASGVLSVRANSAPGLHTLSVQAVDEHKNIAEALATVAVSAVLVLADAPPLTVIASVALSLHTFIASDGIGVKTYNLRPGVGAEYFEVNSASGVLSVRANSVPGLHTLSVQVADEHNNTAEATATVAVSAVLVLADAPRLSAVVAIAEELHTFAASGGVGVATYTIVGGNDDYYFTLDAQSGVLSVSGNSAVGIYTLSVAVLDMAGNRKEAVAVVEIEPALSLATPPLDALARLSVAVAVHTFVPSHGRGKKRYTIIVDESGYFAIDADSGALSLLSNGAMMAGAYTLSVEVSDGLTPPQRATAAAVVQVARNGVFVMGGNDGSGNYLNDVWSSVDGETWRQEIANAGWPGRTYYQAVAHNGRLYALGGEDVNALPKKDVWSSADGATWTLKTSDAGWDIRDKHQVVSHHGRLYLLGGSYPSGSYNDVWSSADGKIWREDKANNDAGWEARENHQAVAHNGRIYVLGGMSGISTYYNDVWSSADGSSWTQETANAGWPARYIHRAVSHHGRLYVLGGNDGNNNLNDVWSSVDGRSWVQEKANNDDFWTKRERHQAVSRDGLLYVLGGNDGSVLNDVWSSADGKSWDKENNAAWLARDGHQAVVFPTPLALSGTSETITLTLGVSAAEVYTVTAQYGFAPYAYSLRPVSGFNIDNNGVLAIDGGLRKGAYAVTVRVKDEEGAAAETIIQVNALSIFILVAAPSLYADSGLPEAVSLHTFTAIQGIGEKTFTIVAGNGAGHFTIDAQSGVLSARSNAVEGIYTLSVAVDDAAGNRAQVMAVVEVKNFLFLAAAPPILGAVAGTTVSLHTFAATGGEGTKTYTLVVGNEPVVTIITPAQTYTLETGVVITAVPAQISILASAGYFSINATSGVLSVVNAPLGLYTLSVQVSDSAGGTVQVGGTVEVVAPLSLADAPPLNAVARLSVEVSLHTFAASGGFGTKRYAIIADESDYFALDETSGKLSLPQNGAMLAGNYTLFVAVSDDLSPPQRVTVAAVVQIVKNWIFALGGKGSSRMNDVWSSAGGSVWAQEKADNNEFWPAREEHQVVAHNGRLYVLGGQIDGSRTSDVWSSADGRSWAKETAAAAWKARDLHQAVVHNGRMYVLGGQSDGGRTSDVWSSVDGKNWTEETAAAAWSGRHSHQAVAHNGRLYVLGGFGDSSLISTITTNTSLNDVWSSVDGKNWTQEKEHNNAVGWIGRTTHQVVSHNGRLYLLGGFRVGGTLPWGQKNDVWSSVDGKSWRLEIANGNNEWPRRYRHQVVSRDGRMYVLGGDVGGTGGGLKNDVWSSADGKIWQQKKADNNEGWSGREFHQAIVFPPSLLLPGEGIRRYVASGGSSEIHTFQAQYGFGQYTYSLTPIVPGFSVGDSSGLLSANGGASIGSYTLTVWVEDGERSRVQTAVKVEVVASIAALSLAGAPSFKVLAGVAMSLHTFAAVGGIKAKTYNLVGGRGYFTLGESSGILSVQAVSEAGVYTLSVVVSDENRSQVTARATVEVVSLLLTDVRLYVVVGRGVSLHTFEAEGGDGTKTYVIVDGDEDGYFTLGASSGVLSARGNATVGIYTLSVAVTDGVDNRTEVPAVVEVGASLYLVDAPSLVAFAGVTVGLYTFAAKGGDGTRTYTLAAGGNEAGYFTLNATSGVLSVANAALGLYTLLVQVSDSLGTAQARGTVIVVTPLFFADVTGLYAIARLSVAVTVHTFTVGGGFGASRYTIIADKSGYFVLDETSGELSLPSNSAMVAGNYTLSVVVSDSLSPPRRATAVAVVQIAKNGIFVLGGNSGAVKNDVWSSADGKAWKEETANAAWPARYNYQALSYQGRLYVLGGLSGGYAQDVWSSADGENWSFEGNAAWSARQLHQAVEYQGRLYVLGGNDGVDKNDVWSSVNGEIWDPVTVNAAWPARNGHQVVVHNGRLYVLGGKKGSNDYRNDVWWSADGVDWSFEGNANWPGRWYHQAVSHQGRLFVMGGEDTSAKGDIWSSVDGKIWEREKADTVAGWGKRSKHQALSNDGMLYVLGGDESGNKNDVWSSADGKSWTPVTMTAAWSARQTHQAVIFPPPLILLVSSEKIILTVGWAGEIYTVAARYGDGQYTYSLTPDIGVNIDSNGVLSADDGTQVGVYMVTVQVEDGEGTKAESIINIEVREVMPVFLAAAPLLEAVARLPVTVALHTFVASDGFGAKRYAVIADESGYFTVEADSGVLLLPSNPAMRGGNYTLSLEASDSLSTPQRTTVGVTVRIVSNQIFVLGGDAGSGELNDVWSSTEGKSWMLVAMSVAWSEREEHQAVWHNGRLYVMGGRKNNSYLSDVWSSVDGETWALETGDAGWEARARFQAVSYRGRLYMMGGVGSGIGNYLRDVWSSADGKSWEPETMNPAWSARAGHQVVLHNGLLYMMGGGNGIDGQLDDIWSSADGKSWMLVAMSVAWSARNNYGAVSHNGRLYVLGGLSDDGFLNNDVWSSTNGKSWRQEKAVNNSGWSARHKHQALSRDGLLYVLGGNESRSGSDYRNDVWSSADGKSWMPVTMNAAWSARQAHQAVVSPPPLVLWGPRERFDLAAEAPKTEIYRVTAQNGFGEYTYSLVPEIAGFEVDSNGGFLADPGSFADGAHTLTVQVEDEDGARAKTEIRVQKDRFVLADAPSRTIFSRLWGVTLHTFTAADGIGAPTYKLLSGSLVDFIVEQTSGVLKLPRGSIALPGSYTLMVEAADSYPQRVTAVMTVRILREGIVLIGGKDGDDYYNDVWLSLDGENWQKQQDDGWAEREEFQAVSHNGRLHKIGGRRISVYYDNGKRISESDVYNDEWYSEDIWHWENLGSHDALQRYQHQVVSHNGRLYRIGGHDAGSVVTNDVWSSSGDGEWELETAAAEWTTRSSPQVVSHRGRMYLLGGGGLKDVWSSAEGKHWIFEGNAEWPGRAAHQAVSHNGRIYVMGGGNVSQFKELNDVWSSADGRSWVLEKADNSSGWGDKNNFQALSHKGLLYVLGGRGNSAAENDVWTSADGKSWMLVTMSAAWSARAGHQAVVFPQKMALWGASENINLVGASGAIHTVTAHYGFGDYTYELMPPISGFSINNNGVLSANGNLPNGAYTLTVRAEDGEGTSAEIELRLDKFPSALASAPPLNIFPRLLATLNVHTFADAYGGTPYTHNLLEGSKQRKQPRYFAIDEAGGVLPLPRRSAMKGGGNYAFTANFN